MIRVQPAPIGESRALVPDQRIIFLRPVNVAPPQRARAAVLGDELVSAVERLSVDLIRCVVPIVIVTSGPVVASVSVQV